jgi:uncharacterized protein with FMN-binding domain
MTTSKHPKQSSRPPIDPLLAQRLQQLGGRRPAGAPLPPPTPGTAARTQAATKQAARPAARPATKAQGTTVISTEPPTRRPAAAPVQGANAAQTAKLQAAAARAAAARNAKAGGKPAPATARKGKPAQSSKVASLAISVATTAVLAGIFAHNAGSPVAVTLTGGTAAGNGSAGNAGTASNNGAATGTGSGVVSNQNAGATASTAPAQKAGTAPKAATTPAAAGGTIKDGTYVGQTQYNRFGPVQVQAVYAGGQLTDVQILQYEDGDNRSIRINQIALPRLIQQSVAAQGTNIDGVSGATYTTRSYVKSLQSAIDAAKQASGIAG